MPKLEGPILHSRYLDCKLYYTQLKNIVEAINHIYNLYKLKLQQLVKQVEKIDMLLDKYTKFQFTTHKIEDRVNCLKESRTSINELINELSYKTGNLGIKYSKKSLFYEGGNLKLWKKEISKLRRNMSKLVRQRLDIKFTLENNLENKLHINDIVKKYQLPSIELLDRHIQESNLIMR